MILTLPPRPFDWLLRRGLLVAAAGVGLMAVALSALRDLGVVTGFMLLMLGAYAAAFRRLLAERGMWRLAGLAAGTSLLLYATMEWDAVRQEMKAPNPRLTRLCVDVTAAAAVVWLQVRFLATVVRVNRALPAGRHHVP